MKIEHFRAIHLTGYKRDYERGKSTGLFFAENEPDRIQELHRVYMVAVTSHINKRQYRRAAFVLGICDGVGNSELEGVVERLMPT